MSFSISRFSRRSVNPDAKSGFLVLALLVTAREHRGRGAGSLLVRWGIEQSEESGLSVYLQASEQGQRLYSRYGFEEIGRQDFDLSNFGLESIEVMTEMIWRPSTKRF